MRRLLDGPLLPAGEHLLVWGGRDDAGARVQDGVYLYRLSAGAESAAEKLAVIH